MKKTVVLSLVICAFLMCLSGCSAGFIGGTSVSYDNADKYAPGDREFSEAIDELDIDWVSGRVTVTAADVSGVSVRETTKAKLDDELKVHTWAEGSILHVRFCKSGERYNRDEDKTVEITVPGDTVYKNVKIDVSSADVSCTGLDAEKADLDASSGNMEYSGNADSFTADSSSGNISFSGEAKSIKADASSGDVVIEQKGSSDSIAVDTSSGNIKIDAGHTGSLELDSSSGSKEVRLAEMPASTVIDSSSGTVTMYLPGDADFEADISAGSADVSFELPMTKNGDETYICGSGENKLRIDTSSGNVKILKN